MTTKTFNTMFHEVTKDLLKDCGNKLNETPDCELKSNLRTTPESGGGGLSDVFHRKAKRSAKYS